MTLRLIRLAVLLVVAAGSLAACIVVPGPAPYPARVYAPAAPAPPVAYGPPPPCRWLWVYNHWECR